MGLNKAKIPSITDPSKLLRLRVLALEDDTNLRDFFRSLEVAASGVQAVTPMGVQRKQTRLLRGLKRHVIEAAQSAAEQVGKLRKRGSTTATDDAQLQSPPSMMSLARVSSSSVSPPTSPTETEVAYRPVVLTTTELARSETTARLTETLREKFGHDRQKKRHALMPIFVLHQKGFEPVAAESAATPVRWHKAYGADLLLSAQDKCMTTVIDTDDHEHDHAPVINCHFRPVLKKDSAAALDYSLLYFQTPADFQRFLDCFWLEREYLKDLQDLPNLHSFWQQMYDLACARAEQLEQRDLDQVTLPFTQQLFVDTKGVNGSVTQTLTITEYMREVLGVVVEGIGPDSVINLKRPQRPTPVRLVADATEARPTSWHDETRSTSTTVVGGQPAAHAMADAADAHLLRHDGCEAGFAGPSSAPPPLSYMHHAAPQRREQDPSAPPTYESVCGGGNKFAGARLA